MSTQNTIAVNNLKHESLFNELRALEYARLDEQEHVYLDFTGGNLYAQSHLDGHFDLLKQNVFGNPHSTNPTSQLASDLVKQGRERVIEFFNAHDYQCIFTQNATGALKIVGESYPFCDQSHFLLLADNHNSVNGIREYCKNHEGSFSYAKIKHEDLTIEEEALKADLNNYQDRKHRLFAFPAQSNVSGVKHDLGWIEYAQKRNWEVLLDAAAFTPTNKLDLSKVKPDFVSISFYKIFGYPTGIGCLLVKNSAFEKLTKRWFAGGTVSLVSVLSPHHFLANNYERYEDGTVNYLDIPAITSGLDFIDNIGLDKIGERVQSLIEYLIKEVEPITHSSGEPVVKMFGPKDRNQVGGTVIMSFFNDKGEVIPFEDIEQLANKKMISIRSGCFCNPGIDEVNNCITTTELSHYFATKDQGDYYDMIQSLQKMRGATRVSVGIASTKKDLDTFIGFVRQLAN